ncbi:MAG: ATP-binding protein [Solirubrobacterales bacterium]|nr:ATP-binding protein [Solirubrobacterales bacterium]MBV9366771.1 ATP-binding protein [Solirubrobacterales bacterium]MBV9683353.1 ATP-binding protein [Solirubrobacterales bacterium]MBV9810145.1 ATP-binding protein [Solirubrobacterales bacterium]
MCRGEALNESYPAVPEAVPLARRLVSDLAAAAGAGGERLEEIRLAVSEALTNAVVHAYGDGDPPGDGEVGRFRVVAAVASSELWVLISDHGRGLHAGHESRGLGIGLSLISALSDDFAIVNRASGGTEVQMRFDLTKTGPTTPAVTHAGCSLRLPLRPHLASRR